MDGARLMHFPKHSLILNEKSEPIYIFLEDVEHFDNWTQIKVQSLKTGEPVPYERIRDSKYGEVLQYYVGYLKDEINKVKGSVVSYVPRGQ